MSKPTLGKIGRVARTRVSLAEASEVRAKPLLPDRDVLQVIHSNDPMADPVPWGRDNRDRIEELVAGHGALLLRGFDVHGPDHLQRFVEAVAGELLEYTYRSTPRTQVEGRVYTSTEYPADRTIPMHNENAYSRSWPSRLFFYSERVAEEGGRTPLADSHRVYLAVPPEVRQRFEASGVMYVRNYGEGVDLPWSDVFQTSDRGEVERFCEGAGIEYEWKPGDGLRTRQVCQATLRHPVRGMPVWFNQAHLFHVSALEPEVRAALGELLADEDLPRNAFFGDGSAIPAADLDAVRAAFDGETFSFPWQEGDLLIVDNMAVAHGRTPFRGERKVRVAMSGAASVDSMATPAAG
jgi:alpha-ketoglutarate-dependent taurine dioxygenase